MCGGKACLNRRKESAVGINNSLRAVWSQDVRRQRTARVSKRVRSRTCARRGARIESPIHRLTRAHHARRLRTSRFATRVSMKSMTKPTHFHYREASPWWDSPCLHIGADRVGVLERNCCSIKAIAFSKRGNRLPGIDHSSHVTHGQHGVMIRAGSLRRVLQEERRHPPSPQGSTRR